MNIVETCSADIGLMIERVQEQGQPMKNPQRLIKSEIGQLVLLIALLLAARSTLADHYYVPSASMEYTLQVGDRVLVDKRAYGFRLPFTNLDIVSQDDVGRGEIVIFDSPKDGKRLIKGVVAVGGDVVTLLNGRLTINGEMFGASDDPSIEQFNLRSAFLNLEHGGGPDLYELQIPNGMLLAMGDHRGRSMDGRFFLRFRCGDCACLTRFEPIGPMMGLNLSDPTGLRPLGPKALTPIQPKALNFSATGTLFTGQPGF